MSNIDTQTKKLFLSIAHQWRQPLSEINSIVGAMDNRLYEMGIEDSQLQNYLIKIENLTKFMSNTIEDFKLQHDNIAKKEKSFMQDILSESIQLVEGNFANLGITIKKELSVKSSYSHDGRLLKQVIVIILNNAKDALLSHSVYKPEIVFYASEDTKAFHIKISDNGGGIPKSIREKMFEENFSTKHTSEGTGMGLYMCKKYIEDMYNGSISVTNNEKGVCFSIALPKE